MSISTPESVAQGQSLENSHRDIQGAIYWKKRLKGFEAGRYFLDRYSSLTEYGNGQSSIQLDFPEKVFTRLNNVAGSPKAKKIVLLATLGVLGNKYSSQEDLVIFCPIDEGDKSMEDPGMVPVRMNLFTTTKFPVFLRTLHEDITKDFHHGQSALNSVLVELGLEAGRSRRIGFGIQQHEAAGITEACDLFFNFQFDESPKLVLSYDAKQFTERYISQLGKHYFHLLTILLNNKDTEIKDFQLITPEEKRLFQEKFNPTIAALSSKKTILDLFIDQVNLHPDDTAVVSQNESCSYEQLHELSDRLAYHLITEHNLSVGDRVGILLSNSHWQIVAILGILKAGGAYVPIDVKYPVARKKYIIEDSQISLLISEAYFFMDIDYYEGNILPIDLMLEAAETGDLNLQVKPDDLAYMIYTSGSMGQPKGVMINHSSLLNYIQWAEKTYLKGEPHGFALLTSLAFDLTVTTIFTPLVSGNQIKILEESDDPSLLEKVMLDVDIDFIKVTPSHLKTLSQGAPLNTAFWKRPKKIVVGGEELSKKLADQIYNRYEGQVEIFNEYGPTEATVGCLCYQYSQSDQFHSVPIGGPIANTQLYILDEHMNITPACVQGEICIAGSGLAKGYFGNSEMTRAKFVKNPLVPGSMMYRTGDLAVRTLEDQVIYIGRNDRQVKLRGYRIDLNEIEMVFNDAEGVDDSIVLAVDEQDDRQLIAYYQADHEISEANLRDHLESYLPEYMIPAHVIHLKQFPLNINGKVDHGKLPNYQLKHSNYIPPSTETQKQVIGFWASVLRIQSTSIGLNDDFFALGGHSIKAITLINKIGEKLATTVSLQEVFDNPTVASLSQVIEGRASESVAQFEHVENQDFYLASSAQERLFYERMSSADNITGNISRAFVVEQSLDKERLESSLNLLMQRHTSLRTGFEQDGDKLFQRVYSDVGVDFTTVDRHYPSIEEAFKDFIKPFDLSGKSQVRFALYEIETSKHVLFVDIHHIVCDGVSLNMLMNDFRSIYLRESLPALEYTYIDYSHWQRSNGKLIESEKAYWLERLSGDLPVVSMPVKGDRNDSNNEAASATLDIDGDLNQQIRSASLDQQVSHYMLMLSAYYVLVSKISGNKDIIVGTDVLGRKRPELNNIVGTFTNVLPLRLKIDSMMTFAEVIQITKNCVLEGLDNQEFQYDELCAALGRGINDPLFHLYFSFINFFDPEQRANDFKPLQVGSFQERSRYELELNISEKSDSFAINFVYNPKCYDPTIISLLKGYYHNILREVVEDTSITVQGIKMTA